jgi:hypothetical protein
MVMESKVKAIASIYFESQNNRKGGTNDRPFIILDLFSTDKARHAPLDILVY